MVRKQIILYNKDILWEDFSGSYGMTAIESLTAVVRAISWTPEKASEHMNMASNVLKPSNYLDDEVSGKKLVEASREVYRTVTVVETRADPEKFTSHSEIHRVQMFFFRKNARNPYFKITVSIDLHGYISKAVFESVN